MPAASPAKRRSARAVRERTERLPPAIRLKQKQSGREKRVATGFAWDLFLFSGFFGLPLFWRRLHAWGAVILALWCVDLIIGRVLVNEATAHWLEAALFGVFLFVQLWLGFRGNRLTARTYLAHGWTVDQSGELGTRRVIERWKLAA